jgi:adenylate cyclase, class 2
MQKPETELKFFVRDIDAFHEAVAGAGFELVTPRTLEQNTLYDTPDRSLRNKRQLLRLRRYGLRHVVTHKRVPDGTLDESRYKTRIETETEVADGHAIAEVFRSLGLEPVFRYEKFRTEWDAVGQEGAHLLLDETAIGTWAELEGDPAWIDTMLATLGVERSDCTTASYGTLFLEWKERTGSPVNDLTFEEIAPEALEGVPEPA